SSIGCCTQSSLFPYTTLFRSQAEHREAAAVAAEGDGVDAHARVARQFGGLERVEHAGGVDAVGEQHQHALSGVLRRQALDRQARSEEHTSELQSRENLVCRLL